MEFRILKGELRKEFGTSNSRRLRQNKKIPATILAKKGAPIHISLDLNEVKKNLNPHHHFYLLEVDSSKYKVFLKNIQRDHLGTAIYQIDFETVEEDKMFEVKIPVKYVGQPKGVIAGGHPEYIIHEIVIKASINNIIEELRVDISDLDLKQKLKLSDVKLPENVTVIKPPLNAVMVIIREAVVEEVKPKEEAVPQALAGTASTPLQGTTAPSTQTEQPSPPTKEPAKKESEKKGKTEK